MSDNSLGPTKDFHGLVRDALLRLHDPSHLETHPLALGAPRSGAMLRGRWLYQLLLDSISALRPASGTPPTSRSWRTYRILELRYIDGREVGDVVDRLAISKIQYYRDYHRAMDALVSVCWDRWQQEARSRSLTAGEDSVEPSALDLTRREAESLLAQDGAEDRAGIDPREVLSGVGVLLQPLCEGRGVDLAIFAPERLPPVRGDRVALRQALLIALTSMIHAVERGVVRVAAEHSTGHVEFRVAGSPLVAAHDPVAASRLEVEPCRLFVSAVGGTVECAVDAAAAEPYRIILRFPVDNHPILLVVDNNADFQRLVGYYLSPLGWRVVGASNILDAHTLVHESPPRAILLDVVIPGRDGWELLTDLRRDPTTRDIPVIICSVLNEPDVAASLGATAYVRKPIDQHMLVDALSPFR